MVCSRCIRVLNEEFLALKFDINSIKLSEVELKKELSSNELREVEEMLLRNGFELLKDKKAAHIEAIKSEISQLIYGETDWDNLTLSSYLEEKLNLDYHYLSSLFSAVESITIEKYMIQQKIERVKEFIAYDELNFSEIAYKLGYSSVQHLSNQFKKVIGLSPSHFKQNRLLITQA
jgi:YesN/AraC family two-component response regulator